MNIGSILATIFMVAILVLLGITIKKRIRPQGTTRTASWRIPAILKRKGFWGVMIVAILLFINSPGEIITELLQVVSWQVVVSVIGIILILLIWPGIRRFVFYGLLAGVIVILLYFPTRTTFLEHLRDVNVSEKIAGKELILSFTFTSMEDFQVCGAKPTTRYLFTKIRTSEKDPDIVMTINPKNEVLKILITGMVGVLEPSHPIQDENYIFGSIAGGVRTGKTFVTDDKGCFMIGLNASNNHKKWLKLKYTLPAAIYLRKM